MLVGACSKEVLAVQAQCKQLQVIFPPRKFLYTRFYKEGLLAFGLGASAVAFYADFDASPSIQETSTTSTAKKR